MAFVFVNDPSLKGKVNRATIAGLSKWGAYIRQTARQSMKKSAKPSRPGQPPRVIEGSVKRLLNFYYDTVSKTVVVGPEIKPDPTGVPHILEFGGVTKYRLNAHKTFKVGDFGPLREITGDPNKPRLAWGRLKTDAQVRRATILWQNYCLIKTRSYNIAPRPYMRPAMLRNMSVAPKCFESVLKGN